MFFNDLKNEFEPDEVFERSKEIWDYLKIKNHGEFIDLKTGCTFTHRLF
jgi:hypothetical protein